MSDPWGYWGDVLPIHPLVFGELPGLDRSITHELAIGFKRNLSQQRESLQ